MNGTEKPETIPVLAKILDGLEAVRRSGLVTPNPGPDFTSSSRHPLCE